MSQRWAVETEALSKSYGAVDAVRRLTMRIAEGGITGFLGRNGAGKSTTVRMLLGVCHPTSGTARVLNRSVTVPRENLDARRRIAYVAEDKQTYGFMTVRQMIAFTRDFYTDWRPDVERRLVETFDLPLDRKVKTLSKGTRTKLALLLALARRPELLILDEPTEGLDPASIEELLRLLVTAAADGTTVLFSSHQIADVERIADHVCILETGRLALDIPLDRVRQHYRRISLGFAAEPPQFPFAVSAGSLHIDGRQLTVTTTQDADAILAWARHVGAASIQSAPITLREVFLDTVSEPRP